jgi:hypothetical protein
MSFDAPVRRKSGSELQRSPSRIIPVEQRGATGAVAFPGCGVSLGPRLRLGVDRSTSVL